MPEDSQESKPKAEQQAAEFPKVYEPGLIERRWAEAWVKQELFRADPEGHGEVFSIVIPPPNVTGYIHIGHMLEHTQIDALTRWHRMRGKRTLWLPGMDHAGISTQVVVERELAKQNVTRQALGREEFERRVWEWKAHSGGTIKKQMIRLGDSCDWSREKFTLDPPLYRAVLEAFLRLYHEGLIYRGRYIVNWCPRCQTALSDLETVHEERNGHLWHIRYPAVGSNESVVVATTRPETMLGDTAVAVNPEDERYKHLAGKKVLLPLMNREIPVIADAAVDREFGTGAVKVTPAHDPNDFEMGRRHKLPEIDVMTGEGRMNANAGAYAGLDRFEARKRIVADLESQGLLVKVEDHMHAIGVCARCKTVIEPRVSMQWFCKMRKLADAAIEAVEAGQVRIVPETPHRKVFTDWLTNIRDWCISRQLWWGHRIPIWHCPCGGITPARDSRVAIVDGRALPASPPEKCAKCGGGKLEQDPDVLDTWFSSGLWPLSTLGWPDDKPDLRAFYPTTLLISGYDILFFWDARMVMLCLHLARGKTVAERIPFRTLYLHSLVLDAQGQKMSKMRGNVIDPLEWMERFGTDALRFTLAIKAAPGTDIALSEEAVSGYKAFANKIWNAARFVFVNLEKFQAATGMSIEELAAPQVRAAAPYPTRGDISLADRWIFSRLAEAIATIDDALENFRFHEAAQTVYHFFWGDFCDWYIEWVKPAMADADRERAVTAWRNLFAVFEAALRLLHPLMPFLTEELWHRLPQRSPAEDKNARSIALQPFPRPAPQWSDPDAEEEVKLLQEVIVAARNVRAELKLDPKRRVAADFTPASAAVRTVIENNRSLVLKLATLSDLHFSDAKLEPSSGPMRSTAQFDLRIAHGDGAERGAELARLRKEKERMARDLESKRNRLADETFRSRAPAEVVRQLEATFAERQLEFDKLTERLAQLEHQEDVRPSSKMPKTQTPAWRDFEKLISQIEGAVAPSGAVVKSPDRIPDKVTGELREVDASIRYKVGTAPIFITIECRDRSGVEDVRWIEQLAEKKRSIGASITLAVSSSGFTEPAVKKAEMSGIEVRSLHDVTAADLAQWLTTQVVVVDSVEWALSGLALELYDAPEDAALSPALQDIFRTKGARAPILVRNSDNKRYSIENILIEWNKQNPNWTHDVPADGTRILRNLHQPLDRGGLHVETSRGNFDVRVIHMSLTVTHSKSQVTVSQLKEYRDASTPLVQTAVWNVADKYRLSMHRDLKSGAVKVTMVGEHQ